MTTTWYVVGSLFVLASLAGVAVLVKPDLLHLLSPTTPDQPGDDDREASGADENWSPMEDVARAESIPDDRPAPDFDTHLWQVDVHAELNRLEDAFHHDVEHFWDWVYDQLQVDARTRLRLPSSIEATGEFDRRELDAMLAVS